MAKVKQPIKEFWETDKKHDFIVLSKTGKDSGIVRVKRLKPKRKNKRSGLKKLEIK